MNDFLFRASRAVRDLSPASRRWRRFLRSLPVDPDNLSLPLAEPGERDFILCGAPRTGTTLLSAMLVQPPALYTVMEPWDGMRLPPAELFASLRASIRAEGTLTVGKLDTAALMHSGEVRWTREGHGGAPLELSDDLVLGVKWPVFWRYLPHLPNTRFIVTLRHPYEVIASFRKHGGRLRMGLEYDTAFNRRMNAQLQRATSSLARRRVLLFDYIHERIVPFLSRPNVLAVRYERWFSEADSIRAEISAFLGVELREGLAKIRRPAPSDLSAREGDLIRSECGTAAALGYTL
ncbi:MAG: sulfotransferase [Gemmatimonadota bacterium]|nr:sulfotransferase [Gemmatimonadota bacterium]